MIMKENMQFENWDFSPRSINRMNWYAEQDAPVGVPVLDLSLLNGDAGHILKQRELELLCDAITGSGFFYIKNFGVSESEIESISNITRAFFGQPESYKTRFDRHHQVRGYSGYRYESTARFFGSGKGKDLCMKYTMGPELTPEELRERITCEADITAGAYAPNIFPTPEFRNAWLRYYRAVHRTSLMLLEAMGEALNLPDTSRAILRNMLIEKSAGELRFFQYPDVPLAACADVPGNDLDRMAAHFDIDVITLLHQTPCDNGFVSLEAQIGREYVKIPAIRGTLVVNLGEILRLLTGNKIKATVHRVVRPPQRLHEGSARDVLVFFQAPPLNARLRPLEIGEGLGSDTVFDRLYHDAGTQGYVTFSQLQRHMLGEFVQHMETHSEEHELDAHLFGQ